MARAIALAAAVALAGACGGGGEGQPGPDAALAPGPDAAPGGTAADASGPDASARKTVFGGARPAELLVPPGYSDNNAYVTSLLGLDPLYRSAGFLLIAPHGMRDSQGNYFWNATDACCDFEANPVDDVAYLNGLVDEIAAVYNVDPRRVYVVGHSNGGFMAHRLACASAERFAAVISVAGATYDDVARCTPAAKVNVLQVHGTNDTTIAYAGGSITVAGVAHAYPGALGTVQRWAQLNGCADTTTAGAALDLTSASGAETDPLAYDGCPAGGAVELWTVNGGVHVLLLRSGQPLWAWLSAHAKP